MYTQVFKIKASKRKHGVKASRELKQAGVKASIELKQAGS